MKAFSAFTLGLILPISAVLAATHNSSSINQPSVQRVDLRTNEVVKPAKTEKLQAAAESPAAAAAEAIVIYDKNGSTGKVEVQPAATESTAAVATTTEVTTTATETTTQSATPRRYVVKRKKEVASLPPTPSMVTVTGRSIINSQGEAVVAVPVAKLGYISGVTASGEIVMIPRSDVQDRQVIKTEKTTRMWSVNGVSQKTADGNYAVIVPVARPGMVSAVTDSGEIIMFRQVNRTTASATTALPATSFVASNAPEAGHTQAAVVAADPQPSPVVYVAQTKTPQNDQRVESELAAANAQVVTQAPTTESKLFKRNYFTSVLGMGSYPQASNIDTGFNVAGAFGTYYKQNFMLEAGLNLAKYTMAVQNHSLLNRKDNFDINQYQIYAAAKYQIVNAARSNFLPIIGALLSYNYRQYSLTNGVTNNSGDTGNSQAIDAGVTAGVDYFFGSKYAIGLDFKYMFNFNSQVNATYTNSNYGYVGTPIESFQYYTAGISGRVNF